MKNVCLNWENLSGFEKESWGTFFFFSVQLFPVLGRPTPKKSDETNLLMKEVKKIRERD